MGEAGWKSSLSCPLARARQRSQRSSEQSSGEAGRPPGRRRPGALPTVPPGRSLGGGGEEGGQLLPPGSQREAAQATSHLPQEGLQAKPRGTTPTEGHQDTNPSLDWGPAPPGRKDSTLLGPITWLLFCLWVAQPGCGPECDTQDGVLGPPEGHSRLPSVRLLTSPAPQPRRPLLGSWGPQEHLCLWAGACPLFPEPPAPGRGGPSARPLQLGASQRDAPSAAGLAKGQGAVHMQPAPRPLPKGCSPVDSRGLARTQRHPTQAVCPQQGGCHAPHPTPPARPQVYTQARPQRHTDLAPAAAGTDRACPRSWALEDRECWPHTQPWMDSISQVGPGPRGPGRPEQQLPQRSGQAAWGREWGPQPRVMSQGCGSAAA